MKRLLSSLAIAGLLASDPGARLRTGVHASRRASGSVTLRPSTTTTPDAGSRDASRMSAGRTETVTVFSRLITASRIGCRRRSASRTSSRGTGATSPRSRSRTRPATSATAGIRRSRTRLHGPLPPRRRLWAVTPLVRYILPSHGYNYQGEAVVGFHRKELALGLNASVAGHRLTTKALLQAGYTYSFVEKFLGIPNDRSNGTVEIGYAVTRRLFVHANGIWQVHPRRLEVRVSVRGSVLPSRGDEHLDTPEKLEDFHRLFRNNYWQPEAGSPIRWALRRLRLVHEVRLGNRHARRAGLHRRRDVVFRWHEVTRMRLFASLLYRLRPALDRPCRPGRGS